jgi:hypothetical protein
MQIARVAIVGRPPRRMPFLMPQRGNSTKRLMPTANPFRTEDLIYFAWIAAASAGTLRMAIVGRWIKKSGIVGPEMPRKVRLWLAAGGILLAGFAIYFLLQAMN